MGDLGGIDDTHMQIVAGEIEKFKTALQSVLGINNNNNRLFESYK